MATMTYKSTKYRLPDKLISRDGSMERRYGIDDLKLYAYADDDSSIYIAGEVFARRIRESFCIICTVYDADDDIIETTENRSYGSGLVTSMITPTVFFDGFPFVFSVSGITVKKIKRIRIAPASSY